MEPATRPTDSTLNNNPQEVVIKRQPEEDILSWVAPSRSFRKYGRKFYVTIFSIIGIVSIIIFIAEGLMPVILIISLIFLFYILSTVPPEDIEYKITNKAIYVAGKSTPWQNIVRFWISTKAERDVLFLDTTLFPGRMEIIINPEIKDKLKREIAAYVIYEERSASTFDKVSSWVIKKLPESE